jgi:hypothetical protein
LYFGCDTTLASFCGVAKKVSSDLCIMCAGARDRVLAGFNSYSHAMPRHATQRRAQIFVVKLHHYIFCGVGFVLPVGEQVYTSNNYTLPVVRMRISKAGAVPRRMRALGDFIGVAPVAREVSAWIPIILC